MLLPVFLTLFAAVGPDVRKVENPTVTSWVGFSKGTSVTYKQVTTWRPGQASESSAESLVTYTLLEVRDDVVVLNHQSSATVDGRLTRSPDKKLELPRVVPLKRGEHLFAGFVDTKMTIVRGEDKFNLFGRRITATKYTSTTAKNEVGRWDESTRWYTGAVPGLELKSETYIYQADGKIAIRICLDVVDVHRP